jgi:5-methylcytosine-specific restriction endonuclease McrBC regulatory subunit McrC
MKALGNMTKKLRELDSALSNLQSIESDLYSDFSDIFDSAPYVEEFSDLNIDQHSHEYSIKNQDIKEVFDDFFS